MGEGAWEPLHFELEFLSSTQENSLIIFSLKIMLTTIYFMLSDRALPWKIVDLQNLGMIKIKKNLLKSSGSSPHPAQSRAGENEFTLLTSLFIYAYIYACVSISILEVPISYCPFFQKLFLKLEIFRIVVGFFTHKQKLLIRNCPAQE